MKLNEKVAKIVEDNFGLKTVKGSFLRAKREPWEIRDGYMAWVMSVDDSQFASYESPIEEKTVIKIWDMFFPRSNVGITAKETMGIYDKLFDNRYTYQLGSEYTLKEIIETVENLGVEYIALHYSNQMFQIVIHDKPVKYIGDYNDMKQRICTRKVEE